MTTARRRPAALLARAPAELGASGIAALRLTVRPLAEAADLARWRDACVARLVERAHARVPFVRRLLERGGVTPRDVRSVSALAALPVTSRRDVQEATVVDRTACDVAAEWLLDRSTSGSTGERVTVKRTWVEERLLNAFRWRALRDYGYRARDRRAQVHFLSGEDPRDDQSLQRLAQRLGLLRRRVFDAIGDPALADGVAAFGPDVVTGMASALARLADALDVRGSRVRPRFVVSGGELLTTPLRDRIARLGAPIHDTYGCNEVNLIAWQCPRGAGTYHVCDDALLLEVLGPDDRPVAVGEPGEVVVTSLHAHAMPVLRYRLGDVAVRGPDRCPCGAPFSTLLAIGGRTFDTFPLENGVALHPWEILAAIDAQLGWVRSCQMVQTARDAIELRVVPAAEASPAVVGRMEDAARSALAGRARFAVRLVEAIEAAPSGKARPFVALGGADNAGTIA
ncbi:MAG: phenylacetate--CoA ligase family protein [Deltaproteobacteria bacterium]|nr:phenylacetate--CoA ligase family protein [Deltaproteobacteria bacterium]